jgi:GT2 family glycosyltransferase
MFVDTVNRAPMLLRRQAMLELGGIDQRYAPFQCDDADLCIRAWKNAWQVAFYDSHFAHFTTEGGMREFNQDAVTRQADANWKRLYELHENFFLSAEHRRRVDELNATLSF